MTLGLRDAKNLVLINRARVVELGDLADPKLDSGAFDRIVKTLAVRYYVSGSYQRAGEEIRVVARLVDATAGTIALQESLTDRFTNLLRLQDELGRRFVTTLGSVGQARAASRPLSSLAAYKTLAEANDLYLAGRYRDAIARLQRSIQEDDTYAEAWALLGKSYGRLATAFSFRCGDGRAPPGPDGGAAGRRAEPRLYEAQVSLALAYVGQKALREWCITGKPLCRLLLRHHHRASRWYAACHCLQSAAIFSPATDVQRSNRDTRLGQPVPHRVQVEVGR